MKLTVMDLFTLLLVLIPTNFCAAFTSAPLQTQTVPSIENTTTTMGSAEEGTQPRMTDFTFSPIWLKDISMPEEEEGKDSEKKEKKEGEDDDEGDKEMVVKESEYVNANSEPIQTEMDMRSEEIPEEEATSSWHVDSSPQEEEEEYDQELEDDDVVIHESVPEQPPVPSPDMESSNIDHQVEVKGWNDRTPHAIEENNIIDSANSVSAPWYDVMAVGLPPSIAYNWQFLMDLSGKLRTAPKTEQRNNDQTPDHDNYNARLKYMLTKIQDMQAAKASTVKLDTLKQKHLLKARLNGQKEHEDDILAWAWRRAAHMQN